MKLWAKLMLNGEKNANHLIRSFFEEFNPESSILIKGKQAEIEVVFEEPPLRTVDAIVHCDIIEFGYEKTMNKSVKVEVCSSSEQSKEETKIPTEPRQIKEETEVTTIAKQAEEETEIATEVVKTSEVVNLPKQKPKNEELYEIPELSEIAKKSSSYEDFVKAVLEWLKFGKKEELFAEIIKVAEQLEVICWKDIKNKLTSKGIAYAKNEDISVASKFKTRFKERKEPITPIPFIKTVIAYQTFDFCSKKSGENTENTARISEIPCLDEVFASVDKGQSIEEKVTYILKSMGLNRLEYDKQEMLCKIANSAITERNSIEIDVIMAEAAILPDDLMDARMTFSSLINDFVKEHNCDQKVKLVDFLEQLRKAVIVEKE